MEPGQIYLWDDCDRRISSDPEIARVDIIPMGNSALQVGQVAVIPSGLLEEI